MNIQEKSHFYKFEIRYANKYLKELSEFMSKCDVINGDLSFKENMTFTTKRDLEISYLKDLIKKAYESCGCAVFEIKGGKIE